MRVANASVISGLRYCWTCWFIVHLHSSNRLTFIQQHGPVSFESTPPHITPFEQNHSMWLFIRSCRSCKSQFPASYSPPFHFFTLIFLSKSWPFQHASVAAFSHLCHKIHPGLSSNPCKSEHLRAADLPLRQNYAHVGIGKETGEGGGVETFTLLHFPCILNSVYAVFLLKRFYVPCYVGIRLLLLAMENEFRTFLERWNIASVLQELAERWGLEVAGVVAGVCLLDS